MPLVSTTCLYHLAEQQHLSDVVQDIVGLRREQAGRRQRPTIQPEQQENCLISISEPGTNLGRFRFNLVRVATCAPTGVRHLVALPGCLRLRGPPAHSGDVPVTNRPDLPVTQEEAGSVHARARVEIQ